jgi:nucleoside-diphosphate-sugar epimerase
VTKETVLGDRMASEMNVLLTGASGYIGRHVFESLTQSGIQVTTMGRTKFDHVVSDLVEAVPNWVKLDRINTVIHCAGTMLATTESQMASDAMASHLLENLPAGVKHLVLVSSAYVYAPTDNVIFEKSVPDSQDLYGRAKISVENIFKTVARRRGLSLVILRPCAVYGPNEPHNKAISKFARMAAQGITPTLSENAGFKRDYIHISDVAVAVVAAALSMSKGIRAFNICTGESWSAHDLVLILQEMNPSLAAPQVDQISTSDVGYKFSPARAKDELGFSARVDVKTGLAELMSEVIPSKSEAPTFST